jgi:hypothetical protein
VPASDDIGEQHIDLTRFLALHFQNEYLQPLPILGNLTPMDAVKDPDGREIVESLVLQGERLGRSPDTGIFTTRRSGRTSSIIRTA